MESSSTTESREDVESTNSTGSQDVISDLSQYHSFPLELDDLSATTAVGFDSLEDIATASNSSFTDSAETAVLPSHDDMIMNARNLTAPPSYYQLPSLNKKPVDRVVRLMHVASQYALPELHTYAVMDEPATAYKLKSESYQYNMMHQNESDGDSSGTHVYYSPSAPSGPSVYFTPEM